MRTSKLKDPVKAVAAIVLFFIFSFVMYQVLVLPARLSKVQDFDTAIVGSSRAKWGFNPQVMLDESGLRAINLASGPAAIKGRFDTLDGAFERYDLDTVILEVAYDAFEAGDVSGWSVYDSIWVIPKMVTFPTEARYVLQDARIPVYDYDKVLGAKVDEGLQAWESLVNGNYEEYKVMAGSGAADANDWHLEKSDIGLVHDSYSKEYFKNMEDIAVFRNMVQMCNDHGVRTIVVTVPNTEAAIWEMSNWDEWRQTVFDALEGLDYEYYDYNLYKNRQAWFSDERSFRDEMHLSGSGAAKFSKLLSREVLNHSPEEIDVQGLFYDSYREAKEHSRYAQ